MTPLLFAAVAVAGGVGAGARYLLDLVVSAAVGARFPTGILVVNVTGSFALGMLAGVVAHGVGDAGFAASWIVGTGLLGGYTTFSGVAVTTVILAEERRPVAALVNAGGTFVLTVAAAWAGLALVG